MNRQSGLLKPSINNSKILGSSLTLPYFIKLADNKDFTFKPSFFDSDIKMIQSEYRVAKENTNYIYDFGFVNKFK